MADRPGRMERMNEGQDLHEQRIEALRRRALDRLRRRHPYHCPDCGYQGSQRDCPRYGKTCDLRPGRNSFAHGRNPESGKRCWNLSATPDAKIRKLKWVTEDDVVAAGVAIPALSGSRFAMGLGP